MCALANRRAARNTGLRPRERILVGAAAIGLAASGALVWGAYQGDLRAQTARIEGRSQIVESPFGSIEYASLGAGPPVLVIHGSGGGFDQGLDMMGPLADHGYRLLSPSRFGYLRSARPANASPEVQADALAWLVRRLGEEKVVVAGGSAGALSAMQFAIRHPDLTAAVVLIVPASYSPDRLPGENGMGGPILEKIALGLLGSDFLFWVATKLAPDQMTRALLATDPALVHAASDAEKRRVRTILDHILPVSRRSAGLIDDTRWAGAPPPYPVERITAPLLAVSLQDDLYGTYEAARHTVSRARNGRLVEFPTGGHVWVGRDDELWAAVAGFLVEVKNGDGATTVPQ